MLLYRPKLHSLTVPYSSTVLTTIMMVHVSVPESFRVWGCVAAAGVAHCRSPHLLLLGLASSCLVCNRPFLVAATGLAAMYTWNQWVAVPLASSTARAVPHGPGNIVLVFKIRCIRAGTSWFVPCVFLYVCLPTHLVCGTLSHTTGLHSAR